jgi:hypothetical protein
LQGLGRRHYCGPRRITRAAQVSDHVAGTAGKRRTQVEGARVNTVPREVTATPRARPAGPQEELVVGRFRLIELLGSGGHGTVWAARDERLRRTVALKRIPRGHDGKGADHRRIDREALAAARLSHPAIVAFHEAHHDDAAYYLVSELVRGSSLAHRYARDRPSDRELVAIGVALADGLAHAHARGVVHRDVKPQNVIIAEDAIETGARAKLTDFGVAQIAGEQPLTRTGDVIGTLAYMAPEQADGKGASAASDLYSLALTLYEGFSGTNPLRGATAVATVKRLGQGIPPLSDARPDLPRRLSAAIDRALSADPARRGRVSDLRDALASARGPRPAEQRTPTLRQRRQPRRAPELSDRARRLAGAACACATAPVVMAGILGVHTGVALVCGAGAALVLVALLPEGGWMGLAFAALAWAALTGRAGDGALLALGLAPVPLLLGSRPWLWCVPVLAPVLGLVGLAAVFPALAARAGGGVWQRAALAASGYWWLSLTEAVLARRLMLGAPAAARPRGSWDGSVSAAFSHVVEPLCSPGRLAPLALWALAAVLLPWILRRSVGLTRVLLAGAWAAGLIVGGIVLAARLGLPQPPLPLAAGVVASIVALAPRGARVALPARPGVA